MGVIIVAAIVVEPLNRQPEIPAPDLAQLEGYSLAVTCFDSLSGCGVSQAEWDEFHVHQRADIFHSYHWVRTWLEIYGTGRTLRLFIIRSRGALAGILPMFYEDHAWLVSGSRVAKQVCADFGITILSLPVEPEILPAALHAIIQHLFREDACDAIQFGRLIGRTETLEIIRRITTRRGLPAPQELQTGNSSQLDLPASFEGYLGSLSKNHRQNFRRTWNRITRDHNCEAEVISSGTVAARHFNDFVEMHARQWQQRGEGGHFRDWPHSRRLHETLLQRAGRPLLIALTANGRPLSYQYCYGLGDRLFWLLPSRLIDDTWQQYGLGRLGFVMMVKAAIERGYRTIDLGGANWQYKSDLGGVVCPLVTITVYSGRAGRLRLLWLALYATTLDIAYYRLWFKRIAPRVGWERGRLWPHWIRMNSFAWRRKQSSPTLQRDTKHEIVSPAP